MSINSFRINIMDIQCLFQTIWLVSKWGVVKTRNAGISRNMAEYHGICRNITEYAGISRYFPVVAMRLFVLKHGRLTTYFITKVMDLSHFDDK